MKSYGNLKLFHIIIDNYHDHAFFNIHYLGIILMHLQQISSSSISNKHLFLQHVFI